MDFSPTEEQLSIRDLARQVAQKELRPRAAHYDKTGEFPWENVKKLAEVSLTGLTYPVEYGGSGQGVLTLSLVMEEIAAACANTAMTLIAHLCTGSRALARLGTQAQKDAYMPRLARGEIRFSVSLSEPNAGSDLAAVQTQAQDAGDHYVLNGQKVWASAAAAEHNTIIMLVRTGTGRRRHEGLTLLLVDKDTPGLEFRKMPTISRRLLGTYEVFITDARVKKDRVLGQAGEAWRLIMEYLDTERLLAAAVYIGNAQTAVDDAVKYAKARVQFGRPIGSFQVIQHKLVDMQMKVDMTRLLVYRAAWLIDQGKPARKEASMAKLAASETLVAVAAEGMQILGGYSQLPEFDMERYFRDSRQTTVSAGTSEIQRNIIAREMGL